MKVLRVLTRTLGVVLAIDAVLLIIVLALGRYDPPSSSFLAVGLGGAFVALIGAGVAFTWTNR